jgi:hypothetical protein
MALTLVRDIRSGTLVVCAAGATLLLTMRALEWTLIDWLTPFLMIPVEAAVWLFFGLACLLALVSAFRHRKTPRRALAPIVLCLSTLALALTVPFTAIWLDVNFRWNRADREDVVRRIAEGKLVPNVKHNRKLIALDHERSISAGGNQVVVHNTPQGAFVSFYTYRGILGNFSVFVWVPDGATLDDYRRIEGNPVHVRQLAKNWYFVAHR